MHKFLVILGFLAVIVSGKSASKWSVNNLGKVADAVATSDSQDYNSNDDNNDDAASSAGSDLGTKTDTDNFSGASSGYAMAPVTDDDTPADCKAMFRRRKLASHKRRLAGIRRVQRLRAKNRMQEFS